MPLINLILEQRVAVRQRERRARTFFFAFVGVSVFSVGSFGLIYLETESIRGDVATASRKLTKLQPVLNAIEDQSKEMQSMAPRLTTLQNAQGATQRWSRILDFMTRNMPEGTWLTNVRSQQSNPSEAVTVTFTGLSSSQDSVANLMLRLRQTPDLDKVELKYTQEDTSARQSNTIKFEVVSKLPGTETMKPKPTKKGEGKENAA